MCLMLLFLRLPHFSMVVGFEYYDNIIANNMDAYGGINKHPTALKEAFEKGQTVVRVLEKLNAKIPEGRQKS